MILTEEEARMKWCPETRVAIDALGCGSANRFGDGGNSYLGSQTVCIGSACMAWRWGNQGYEEAETSLGQKPKGDGWRQIDRGDSYGLRWRRDTGSRQGYCGKAGKP